MKLTKLTKLYNKFIYELWGGASLSLHDIVQIDEKYRDLFKCDCELNQMFENEMIRAKESTEETNSWT